MFKTRIRDAKSYLKSGRCSASYLFVNLNCCDLWTAHLAVSEYVVFWFGFAVEKNFLRYKVFIVPPPPFFSPMVSVWVNISHFLTQCINFAFFKSSVPSYADVLKYSYPQWVCFHVFPLFGWWCQMGSMQIVELLCWYIARCFLFRSEYAPPLTVVSILIFLLKSFWFIFMASSLFSF